MWEKSGDGKYTRSGCFFQQNDYLKKGGELIISYQLEYYEKNLVSYLVLTAVLFFMVIVYPAIVKK